MTPPQSETPPTEQRRTVPAGLILVIVTLALFWPATRHDFMLLDDPMYVVENPHVTNGLSWADLKWAFTNAYAANWHPLTWISHSIDCVIFGLFAGGHHLTNILFHAANTLLLFLALKRMTQAFWQSLVVAALFGWHPLHVESVAWISERKDVLSTFFSLLTLLAYTCYAEQSKIKNQKSKIFYTLALLCFALGLLSKPMVVTLPCVLLLIDFWPLRRIADLSEVAGSVGSRSSLKSLLLEKIPFFALAFAACVATVVAQGTAVRTVAEVPLRLRVLNALTAYAHYAGKVVWPFHLSIFYLLPTTISVAPAVCAALGIIVVSVLAFRYRLQSPWFLVGWLWFLGTLVPVIGLVQVGSQAMADRYSYVPIVGLFIAAVWGLASLFGSTQSGRAFSGVVAAACLLACLALTRVQLGYWRDNISLFQHAVNVEPDNFFAEYELGVALANADRNSDAILHHEAALRINPDYEPAHYRIGLELAAAGKLDEAAGHFSDALKRDPTSQELHNNLGVVLARQDKLAPAIEQFQQAIQINPNDASAYLNSALAYEKLGQAGLAFTNFSKARELAPASPQILARLAYFLATCPEPQWHDTALAVRLAENANKLTQRQNPYWLATLATTSAVAGNFSNAVATAELAHNQAHEQHLAELAKELETDLASYRSNQSPVLDWRKPRP